MEMEFQNVYVWANSKPLSPAMIENIKSQKNFYKLIDLNVAAPEIIRLGKKVEHYRYDQATDYLFKIKLLVKHFRFTVLNPEGDPAFHAALGTATTYDDQLWYPYFNEKKELLWQDV